MVLNGLDQDQDLDPPTVPTMEGARWEQSINELDRHRMSEQGHHCVALLMVHHTGQGHHHRKG